MLLSDAVAQVASEIGGVFEILSGVIPPLREHATLVEKFMLAALLVHIYHRA